MGVDNYDCSCFDLQEMKERALAAEAKLERIEALAAELPICALMDGTIHVDYVACRLREVLGERK